MLHSHLLGSKIKLRWERDGKELEPFAVDENYDFNYQDFRQLSDEITIMPVRTKCFPFTLADGQVFIAICTPPLSLSDIAVSSCREMSTTMELCRPRYATDPLTHTIDFQGDSLKITCTMASEDRNAVTYVRLSDHLYCECPIAGML